MKNFIYPMFLFVASVTILFGQVYGNGTVAAYLIFWVPIGLFIHQWWSVHKKYSELRENEPENVQVESNNIYQDFTKKFYLTLLIGAAQVLLVVLYVGGVWQLKGVKILEDSLCNYGPGFNCVRRSEFIGYYIIAVFIEIAFVFGKDMWSSRDHSVEFWAKVFHSIRDQSSRNKAPDGYEWHEDVQENMLNLIIWYRFLYCTLINSAGLRFIMMCLPLHVAIVNPPNPLMFVLNVVAALYVIELDDRETQEIQLLTPSRENSICSDIKSGDHSNRQLNIMETDDDESLLRGASQGTEEEVPDRPRR